MSSSRADARNALLCAALVIVAIIAVWPVAELSFNDDWSYAFTVKRLLETGHILYNGWSSPSVITQSYWALLWIKALGFSFNVLRLSTMPLAAASVGISYLLARRAGLAVSAATFVAMLFGFSPLFLPLATSFMSDVPGCFCILLAVYAFVRSAESNSRTAAVVWLLGGVVVSISGGSSRQIVYIAALALVPYVAWLRQREMLVVATAAAGWVLTLGAAVLIQRWFERQPFALPEPSMLWELKIAVHEPVNIGVRFAEIILTLLLLVLPAATPLLRGVGKSRQLGLTTVAILLVTCLVLLVRPFFAFAPWLGNLITPWGIYNPGDYGVILGSPVRFALAMAVYAVIAVLLAMACVALAARPARALTRSAAYFLQPKDARATAPAILILIASYLALLLTRCALDVAYDRHVMPLIPLVAIPLLLLGRVQSGRTQVPAISWVLLVCFGLFAVASTQESFAHSRARVAAARRLTDAGVPRNRINGGFEYSYWTELEITGYINDPRIKNPPDAFQKGEGQTPHVDPQYRLEFAPTAATVPTPFGSVSYFSLLPPMHRQVYADRYLVPPGPDPFRPD